MTIGHVAMAIGHVVIAIGHVVMAIRHVTMAIGHVVRIPSSNDSLHESSFKHTIKREKEKMVTKAKAKQYSV